MAEFEHLGARCSHPDCRTKDFLPFTCDKCHQKFCLDHRTYASHNCPHARAGDANVIACPICERGVPIEPGVDVNVTFERHLTGECPGKKKKKPKCGAPGCKTKLTAVNKFTCPKCRVDAEAHTATLGPTHQAHLVMLNTAPDAPRDIKKGDTGLVTQEGQLSGGLAAAHAKKREQARKEYEDARAAIAEQSKKVTLEFKFDEKPDPESDPTLPKKKYGLLTKEEVQARNAAERERRLRGAAGLTDAAREALVAKEAERARTAPQRTKQRLQRQKRAKKVLSFAGGDESDEDDSDDEGAAPALRSRPSAAAAAGGAAAPASKRSRPDASRPRRLLRAPNADASILPDHHREAELRRKRQQLEERWKEEQEAKKKEKVEIVYSYWDGSGHRRKILVPKGTAIGQFLEWVRQDLSKEFPQLAKLGPDQLLYVKEDLILPQNLSFYDLIETRARGKSGPLFEFGVREEVRLQNDASVEQDESHPGKVVQRGWYESNKHIFPASRWETYDPKVQWDRYTTHGKELRKKKKKQKAAAGRS